MSRQQLKINLKTTCNFAKIKGANIAAVISGPFDFPFWTAHSCQRAAQYFVCT